MKTKKMVVILIAVAFVLITILAMMTLFSVRKIEVKYQTADNTDAMEVQRTVDEYLGSNLLFFDVNKVVDSLNDFNYLEIVSVEKKYPNVISLSVKERREVYSFEYQDKVYVCNERGFVVKSMDLGQSVDDRNVIELKFNGVSIVEACEGKIFETNAPKLLQSVFDMAMSVYLSDCIKSIELIKPSLIEEGDVEIETYTGVKMRILFAETDGVDKIMEGFSFYESRVGDYEKAFDTLIVSRNRQTGKIDVVWSDRTEID